MTAALAGLCGAVVAAGVITVTVGMRRRTVSAIGPRPTLAQRWAQLSRRPPGTAGRRRDQLLITGLVAGLIMFAVTGWALAIPLVPLLVLVIPYLLGTPRQRDVVLMESLDRWVRTLTALMATGKSVVDAIRASRRQAPAAIDTEIERLVSRLDQRWRPEDALRAMADDLDSPDADSVLAALMLASRRGGTGTATTLKALSDNIQDRLRARREIEAERAKPRIVVRQITVISILVLTGAFFLGRGFLTPYTSGIGQVLLAVMVMAYLGSLIMLRRLTNPPRRDRILTGQEAR